MYTQLQSFLENANLPLLPLINALPCGVIMADQMGTICYWNNGAEQQFQFTKDETIGQNLMMLMPDRFVSKHVNAMKKRREENICGPSAIVGNTVEIFGRKKDGSEFPIQLSITEHYLDNTGQRSYMGIICDLSDIKMTALAECLSAQLRTIHSKLKATDELIAHADACPITL